MIVTKLVLRNFRNYEALTLSPSPGINIFLGANAQGKTNILEAICYASLGRSHRTSRDADLIRWEAEDASVQLAFSRLGVKNLLSFRFARGRRRTIEQNGASIRTRELIGAVHTVLFSPEDLLLVKGTPSGRRRFLDAEISQASPAYFQELLRYHHLLKQRGALLKEIRAHQASERALLPWDPQLAKSAAFVVARRLEAVERLTRLGNTVQQQITGEKENLRLAYEISGREAAELTKNLSSAPAQDTGSVTKYLEAWYNKKLKASLPLDILHGATTCGPHRDDLGIYVNGVDLKAYGSQGQQRTGALALKLAELEFLRQAAGEYPVLLLDDVMSELDADRRRELLAFLEREKIQTIITATDAAYFPEQCFGTFYEVSAGTVRRRAEG